MSGPQHTISTGTQRQFGNADAEEFVEKMPDLNTALHRRIQADGTAKASTYGSAMAALAKIRKRQAQPAAITPVVAISNDYQGLDM